MSNLKFDITAMNRLFPFCFVTDNNGRLIYLGSSIKKLIPQQIEDFIFDDLFDISRPANAKFETINKSAQQELIALKLKTSTVELMGQVIKSDDSSSNLFVMNLVVQNADELINMKLNFNDFAIHDPIFDYLMLLQTQRRAIRQSEESNLKLQQAHSLAVKASDAKSQFLANMSHELRTPMNGLLGMASILQETKLDNDQQDYLQTLISSGETMLALINDILDLSKIEAGFIKLEPEDVNIRNLIDEIRGTVMPLAQKKALHVGAHIQDNVPTTVHLDRLRLRQVILNLVGNAVKFTATGGVRIFAELINHTDLQITVEDSGIGMSTEVLNKLFKPFVQGDSSMTKRFEGTGLGLSICKKIVEAMNGEIDVTSIERVGSKFTLRIPLNASV